MKNILLLADGDELPDLIGMFHRVDATARVTGVSTIEELTAATENAGDDLRLLAFCTDVIVPKTILNRLNGPAYNVHPGPPQVRGVYPSVFALYQGIRRFGATLHELAEEVDSGTIVAVDYKDLPDGMDRLKTEMLARDMVTTLLKRMAPALLNSDDPLPPIDEQWSGYAWSKRDFDDLCRLPEDITQAEYDRRYNAVGEGPDHALYFERFDRRFALVPPNFVGPIVKGGRQVG